MTFSLLSRHFLSLLHLCKEASIAVRRITCIQKKDRSVFLLFSLFQPLASSTTKGRHWSVCVHSMICSTGASSPILFGAPLEPNQQKFSLMSQQCYQWQRLQVCSSLAALALPLKCQILLLDLSRCFRFSVKNLYSFTHWNKVFLSPVGCLVHHWRISQHHCPLAFYTDHK